MSIEDMIRLHEDSGEIVRFDPRTRRHAQRRLFVTRDLQAKIDDKHSVAGLIGAGFIRASFTRWSSGGLVHSNGKSAAFLKRLKGPPPEVWEIRITEPTPQGRVFGRFVAPDALLVTGVHTRALLGKLNSPGWKSACNSCVAVWDGLFPDIRPFSGKSIHDYVTDNCDDYAI